MKEIRSIVNTEVENINDYSSVGEFVYAEIRRQIINWQLKPGQRISEAEMSKVLEVSRTPVREGFLKLKNEGLVDILAQRGTIISKVDVKKVTESVFIRDCLEKEIIRLISGNLTKDQFEEGRRILRNQREALENEDYYNFHKYDNRFHKYFFESADKMHTWNLLQTIDAHSDRVRVMTLLDFDKFKMLFEEHTAMFEAIVSGKPDEACAILDKHIKLIFKELEVLQKEYAPYFEEG